MLNYVTIEFPTVKLGLTPDQIYSFSLHSQNFAHEVAVVRFRDWDISYDVLKPGTPVSVLLQSPEGSRRFYSYIHYVNPVFTPGQRTTEIMLIGASYKLKQASQRIFTGMTADKIVSRIARSHGFAADVEKHPRVWDQVAQAGHTDLELMTLLAKRTGYNLRIIGTTVEFKPHNFEFGRLRASAPSFSLRDPNDPNGSTLYSFNLLMGDALDYGDTMKAAIRVSGVDAYTASLTTAVQTKRPTTTRVTANTEMFDRFATSIVAPAFDTANYEAVSQDARNRYPYRALIEVAGNPEVLPAEPIYLDGLGNQYSGYWIPLNVEHQVQEETRNRMRYTTLMEVGADSLGMANVWTDGVAQAFPVRRPKRTPAKVKRKVKEGTKLTGGIPA